MHGYFQPVTSTIVNSHGSSTWRRSCDLQYPCWLMISSGVIIPNMLEIITIHEWGNPFLNNQFKGTTNGFVHCSPITASPGLAEDTRLISFTMESPLLNGDRWSVFFGWSWSPRWRWLTIEPKRLPKPAVRSLVMSIFEVKLSNLNDVSDVQVLMLRLNNMKFNGVLVSY